MKSRKRQTSCNIRRLMVKLHNNGKSQREIAKIVGKNRTTVPCIITYTKKILAAADERWNLKQINKDSKENALTLTKEVEQHLKKKVHPENIRRVLRKNELHGRIARKKPYISEKNRKVRVKFADEYIGKDISFWKNG
ncbi:Transposase [Popillia japonica]|uniref:Transposase n=1 Tax=Popillia japonica TaxID=7064 RepID=A0AAW1JY87_POPJA